MTLNNLWTKKFVKKDSRFMKELEEFAKKIGRPVEDLKKELEEIKEDYGVRAKVIPEATAYAQAFAQLKARYALRHLKEGLKRERYPGLARAQKTE